ncbi:MAG: protein kinase [Deltaproteobacteria bacterium]|nr:protein kinase [Deltaproteobacteria bacterium]
MAGTPAYMAPEQVMGVGIDARADLYALGVMTFEMLTGQAPWTGGNHVEVAMARLHKAPVDPRTLAPMPDWLAELVMRCMANDPGRRPSSPEEVAEILSRLACAPQPAVHPGTMRDPTSSSMGSSFAPTSPGERALAIMPFRYRGDPNDAYLAEALTDELVDLLAMTRGLRVSASGATSKFREERDARTVGRALNVDAIIDGTIQRSPDKVRIVARLIDVDTGFQRWSERFEGRLEDVFALQDRMAKRVAEALRVELTLLGHGAVASAEAVELYLRGRALARESDTSGRSLQEAVDRYERARAIAPTFALPLAACADATVRRWFISRGEEGPRWAQASAEAVEAALAGAPDVAETHLAAARLEVNRGQFTAAARHLTTALQIAPTYAAAHEYLGMLQCDAGRSSEGVMHIRLAHELDPSLSRGSFAVLRHHALSSNFERYEVELADLRRNPKVERFGLDLFELRFAIWAGDLERARSVSGSDTDIGGAPGTHILTLLRSALEPDTEPAQLDRDLRAVAESAGSPRLRTVWRQVAVEVLAQRDAHEAALRTLVEADAESVLLDADWLESCRVLAPLHDDPRFAEIRSRVRGRADTIWRAGRTQAP